MREQTIQKPAFREVVGYTTINLDDVGLVFNASEVGPMNFAGLRNANYGKRFKMSTMPELVPLIYASLENQNYETAQNIVKTLNDNRATGNTGIFYFPDGIFFQDNPKMKNGRIMPLTQKTLEEKLGKDEKKGVVFSNDKTTRFVPYIFKTGTHKASDLAKNPGVIALTSSEENAEKFAKASKHFKSDPYFRTLNKVESPQIRVVGMDWDRFNDGLDVVAGYVESDEDKISFGVKKK